MATFTSGNMFASYPDSDLFLVEGHGSVNRSGKMTMGGKGLIAQLPGKFPGVDTAMGKNLLTTANGRYGVMISKQWAEGKKLGLFQTRLRWSDRVAPELVSYAVAKLKPWALENPTLRIDVEHPDVSRGPLYDEVRTLLAELPDNVHIWTPAAATPAQPQTDKSLSPRQQLAQLYRAAGGASTAVSMTTYALGGRPKTLFGNGDCTADALFRIVHLIPGQESFASYLVPAAKRSLPAELLKALDAGHKLVIFQFPAQAHDSASLEASYALTVAVAAEPVAEPSTLTPAQEAERVAEQAVRDAVMSDVIAAIA